METDQQSNLEEKFTILVVDTEGEDVESRQACTQAEDNHVCEVEVQSSMTVGRLNAWIAHNFSHPQWLVVQGRIIECNSSSSGGLTMSYDDLKGWLKGPDRSLKG